MRIDILENVFSEFNLNKDCAKKVYYHMYPIRVAIGIIGIAESATTSLGTGACLLNMQQYCTSNSNGIFIDYIFLSNEDDKNRGYATLMAKMMANDKKFTHLFMLSPMCTVHEATLEMLLEHDVMMIGAAIPKMGIDWDRLQNNISRCNTENLQAKSYNYVINYLPDERVVRNSIIKVAHISNQCTLIKREAIEKMMAEYPELKYDDDIGVLTENENKYLYGFYLPIIAKNERDGKIHYNTGDYAFCERWRAIGGDVHLDVSLPVSKTGSYTFRGHYLKSIQFQSN